MAAAGRRAEFGLTSGFSDPKRGAETTLHWLVIFWGNWRRGYGSRRDYPAIRACLLLLRSPLFASELLLRTTTMGKKGKKAQAGKPKKLTPKDIGKRLDVLAKNLEEELEGVDLFAPLPPTEDCAICFVPLSRVGSNSNYWVCCGKLICAGCDGQTMGTKDKPDTCPFCREPRATSSDVIIRQIEARALKNDVVALNNLGGFFTKGEHGFPKDYLKALDCYIRAVELGSPEACTSIGGCYKKGTGVAVNKKRAALFERVGALRGSITARHNIGLAEYKSGNHEIGIRHWKIAAEGGCQPSLDPLKKIYNADGKIPGKEFISKECMDSLYRVCHDAQEEVKSEEREKHRDDAANMKC